MHKIYTIGFTRKSAEVFFNRLITNGVEKVIDVRLNNISQLAGFTKKDDLKYFLKTIGGISYEHQPLLAPTNELMGAYKSKKIAWPEFERQFRLLLWERQVETRIKPGTLDRACLLCSEASAENCHRRLAAEYFAEKDTGITVEHL